MCGYMKSVYLLYIVLIVQKCSTVNKKINKIIRLWDIMFNIKRSKHLYTHLPAYNFTN